jgi:outer membrane protein assembly factor BamA
LRKTFFKRIFLSLTAAVLGTALFSPDAESKVAIIPLPAISTSRNEGVEVGNLTAFLFTNDEGVVRYIMAPSITYNKTIGLNLVYRLIGFEEGGKSFQIVAGHSIDVDYEFSARYQDPKFLNGRYAYSLNVDFFRVSTYRFFGFTNQSSEANETNYTDGEFKGAFSFGRNFNDFYRLSFTERLRRVRIDQGKVEALPFTGTIFPDAPGLSGALILGERLSLTYDSRDDVSTTSSGSYGAVYAELAHDFENNDSPIEKYGLDLRHWIPMAGKKYVTAMRGRVDLTTGQNRPFYERSTLGGDDTLRNFGAQRFIDDHSILFNIEERIDLLKTTIFGIVAEWELAPFLDVGKVFSDLGKNFWENYQANPGVGFRALVRPNVVGRFDFGFGPEGATTFVGLGFPF